MTKTTGHTRLMGSDSTRILQGSTPLPEPVPTQPHQPVFLDDSICPLCGRKCAQALGPPATPADPPAQASWAHKRCSVRRHQQEIQASDNPGKRANAVEESAHVIDKIRIQDEGVCQDEQRLSNQHNGMNSRGWPQSNTHTHKCTDLLAQRR